MADYYSILARAVSRLETNNAQVRQELYEYARAILNAHFDRSDPQISALGVIDERVEFETAILRVEAELQYRPERSPETFRDAMPDFASLLREPVVATCPFAKIPSGLDFLFLHSNSHLKPVTQKDLVRRYGYFLDCLQRSLFRLDRPVRLGRDDA